MKNKLLYLLLVFLFACKQGQEGTIINRQNNQSFSIGVALSLTGKNANYGKRSYHGIQWAVEKINSKGGINGRSVNLIVEDTKSSSTAATSAILKLITVDKLDIIIGDIISGTTLAMAPIAEENSKILFAPGASSPKVKEAGDYIFRNWTSDDFDGKVMAQYCFSKGHRKIGIITELTDYTYDLAKAFKNEFERLGGENYYRKKV